MKVWFCRTGRTGAADVGQRIPELHPLREKSIAIFGLGCLGAPSALEFARSGIREMRLLDSDFVDPATISRWPYGMEVSGLPKVTVIADAVRKNYPYTRVLEFWHRLGVVRTDARQCSDRSVLEEMTADISGIFDATAEVGVQHLLSDWARERGVPYVGIDGTQGGWGGKIVSIVPKKTKGCWFCQRCAFSDGTFEEPPSDPQGEIQPAGCGDPTFIGSGFDLTQLALTGVRMMVSSLCEGAQNAYPAADWDITVASFRETNGELIPPKFTGYRLAPHPNCPVCHAE